MKKIILNMVFATVIVATLPACSTAQGVKDYSYSKTDKGMQPPPVAGINSATMVTDDPGTRASIKSMEDELKAAKANYKANNNFSKHYKDAADVSWSTQESVIVASFSYAGTRSRVVYNKKGNWNYSILNYYEEQLAPSMRSQVKDQFPSFKINLVQEVTQGNAKVFIIHLENDSTIKKILIRDDEITEYQEFTKSR